MTKNDDDYALQAEADLLTWAARVAAVDRKELVERALTCLNSAPKSRAEMQRRYRLAEVFVAIFKRQLERTPDDDVLPGLIGKLEIIMAEGDGRLDTNEAWLW